MPKIRNLSLLVLALALTLPSAGSAQRRGELTLYSEIGFRGRTYVVTGPREHIRLPFTVRSAQVASGDAWQICPNERYRGNCNVVSDSQGNVAWTVRSARPTAPISTLPEPGNTQSLRGMSAEFFPQPNDRNGRVLSCTSGAASCASQRADQFCVSRGWTASSYERQETVGGRIFLADVLCTQTGR